ncbi:hypothetical protein QBZ16_004586 [Prototheca wickerhamii]|uniref:Glutaminase n=1 Tax=Prototheca wickerhamii TaxID=3111 RepID=A0AAD9IIJ0_PROWI|nr:hypothetical protein QBZ16_004586 [Prototheca wickerhamii]
MALVAERWGLISELQDYAKSTQQPIWGTCAGLIFLADKATNMKQGGQALIGGLDVTVSRNFFGAQINSFETRLPAPACLVDDQGADQEKDFRALFIRAPAITEVGEGVDVLASYALSPQEKAEDPQRPESVIVAVRSGNLLATSFHPELVDDVRWHALFVKMVRDAMAKAPAKDAAEQGNGFESVPCPRKPRDLPKH